MSGNKNKKTKSENFMKIAYELFFLWMKYPEIFDLIIEFLRNLFG